MANPVRKPIVSKPAVTSMATQLKRTIQPLNDTTPATTEETLGRKKRFLSILDRTTDAFMEALDRKEVEIKTSADLDRIIKLTLLLSGEPDNIQGKQSTSETETTTSQVATISMSKVEQILDPEDKDVQNMFQKLYKGYNQINDAFEDNK